MALEVSSNINCDFIASRLLHTELEVGCEWIDAVDQYLLSVCVCIQNDWRNGCIKSLVASGRSPTSPTIGHETPLIKWIVCFRRNRLWNFYAIMFIYVY